jgi:DNA polymerase (family 10)
VPVLKTKMAKVKALDKSSSDIRVFCGSEVDILANGKLDYPDETLAELDCVVGSVHSRFNEPEDVMTERICNALKNKHLDILGHLSGRLINKRPSYAINMEKILQTAKETGSAIEVNGQPERQELSDVYVRRAIELGIPLALTTDAHSTSQLNHMTLALHIARRGWAEAKHILNSFSAKEIITWLKTHK